MEYAFYPMVPLVIGYQYDFDFDTYYRWAIRHPDARPDRESSFLQPTSNFRASKDGSIVTFIQNQSMAYTLSTETYATTIFETSVKLGVIGPDNNDYLYYKSNGTLEFLNADFSYNPQSPVTSLDW